MIQEYSKENWTDESGNPAGGIANAVGVEIEWQKGPLGRGDERRKPNGAFIETVISIVADRLEFYQASKFACRENQLALEHLNIALGALDRRTKDREDKDIEGTHGKRETEYDGRDDDIKRGYVSAMLGSNMFLFSQKIRYLRVSDVYRVVYKRFA